jgi:hypothetical protein
LLPRSPDHGDHRISRFFITNVLKTPLVQALSSSWAYCFAISRTIQFADSKGENSMKRRSLQGLFVVSAILLLSSLANARSRSSSLSVPAGTPIQVRVNENLSSETARAGDTFTGTLAQSLNVGNSSFPRGTSVTGQVISAKKSGRLSDPGVLELALTSVGSMNVSSEPFVIKGASHTKSNVGKIGGGTAAGAIIGAMVGGGKGAAIGAGVGAAGGTATAAATGKKPATVESEAVLQFVSSAPLVTPQVPGRSSDSGNRFSDDIGRRRSHHDDDGDDDDDDDRGDRGRGSRDNGYYFSDNDRNVLSGCLSGYNFESLPPGIQKKLARGGTLPPGQAKKLRAMPAGCTARLPRLPRGVDRIIFGDRVILLDGNNRILDMLEFGE